MESDRAGGIRSQINVTPLVDVCLVLLIIFMVVTPMMMNEHQLQLPEGAEPEKKPQTSKQLRISLGYGTSQGLFLGTDRAPLTSEALRVELGEIYRRSPDREVVVRADRRLSYGVVKEVLRVVSRAGFRDVGIIAEREKPGGGRKSPSRDAP